ncbi:MAG: hypothetical protein DLM69_04495 [Candidatus Chloroheliales bacterium]|nr:MAG: hypothetical protein DLM69_04495 [Chloroflexota bacterium]
MNNRFTEQAQQAIQYAHEILQQKQHTQLDVEHILLALLKQPDSTVARILQQMKVDVRALSIEVDAALSNIPPSHVSTYGSGLGIYITMRVKRMFEVAAEEADRLGDTFISTEHLFFAVAAERTGPSARLLQQFKIDKTKLYATLRAARTNTDTESIAAQDSPGEEIITADQLSLMRLRLRSLEHQVSEMQQKMERLQLRVDAMISLFKGEPGKPRSHGEQE